MGRGERFLNFVLALILVLTSALLMGVALLLYLPLRILRFFFRPLSVALVLGVALWCVLVDRPTGRAPVLVEIPRGATASQVAEILDERGLIRSRRFFLILSRLSKEEIKAGAYEVDGRWPTHRIFKELCRGKPYTVRVTIPVGLTLRQIAGILQHKVGTDSAALISLATDSSFVRSLGIPAPTLEGYLFPDTYRFPWRSSPEAVLRAMVENFHRAIPDTVWRRAEALGITPHQVVILASIVEKEAMVEYERPIIASVFLRRLRLGYPLQSCATVLYAMGKHKAHLNERDLHFPSPYNTYLHRGLPPGPICNPGRASILAVLHPAKEEYLYFVSKGDGTHIFSRSYREHLRAKRMVRRRMTSGTFQR